MKHARKHVPAGVTHKDWLLGRLRDPELAAEYLIAALAEGDPAAFALALRDVANARGDVAVSRKRG
jgi:DNA-binding phage protein